MREMVDRYYRGIGGSPSATELDKALESIRFMLLDGVSLSRVDAAVDESVRLHHAGRHVPFEIAVPLRVRPAGSEGGAAVGAQVPGTTAESSAPAPGGKATSPPASAGVEVPPPWTPVKPLSPEEEARRAALRQAAAERRARLRLYDQWRDRTREKRVLLSVGIPLWALGYGLGFGTASALYMAGAVEQRDAWLAAIPLGGNIAFAAAADGAAVYAPGFAALELGGAALTITGIALKADWPYKRDPTALRLGRARQGGPALVLRVVPAGASGAMIYGKF
jgi:hypothetical protein